MIQIKGVYITNYYFFKYPTVDCCVIYWVVVVHFIILPNLTHLGAIRH